MAVITGDSDKKRYHFTKNPTSKTWFNRFMDGLHNQMGDCHKPDLGVSMDVMLNMMDRLDIRY